MYEKYLVYFRTVYKENHMGWTVTEQVRKSLAMGLAQAGLDQLLRGGLGPRKKIKQDLSHGPRPNLVTPSKSFIRCFFFFFFLSQHMMGVQVFDFERKTNVFLSLYLLSKTQ